MSGEPATAVAPAPHLDTRVASALAVPSRARLLQELRAAGTPQTAADLAGVVGLHVNTVRAHLEQLVDVRLVTRTAQTPHGPGRPCVVYAVAPDAPSTPALAPAQPVDAAAGYRELAGLLVEQLAAGADAERVAVSLGHRWSSVIDELDWPDRPHTEDESRARLVELLDRLGFAPSTEPLGDRIYLHACPFAELARRHATVVCGIHRGLLQGAVGRLQTRLSVSSVDPFVRDNLCVVSLAAGG